MTVNAAQFRKDFTAFADTEKYPNSSVDYWISIAGLMLNVDRWSTLLDHGAELFTAHNLVLEAQTNAAAANGAPPGVSQGPISNKSVDKVSVAYDTASAVELNAGHWNLTIYGTRFIRLARQIGAGPVQVGAVLTTGDSFTAQGVWPGPPVGQGYP